MVADGALPVVRCAMASKSFRERVSSFTGRAAAVALGAGFGGLVSNRVIRELQDLDADQISSLVKKYLPLLMATAGKSMTSEKAGGAYACDDCAKEFMPIFMLRDELWWTVLTEEERTRQFDTETREALCPNCEGHKRVALCLSCCAKRLGRPLRPEDFAEDYWTSSMLGDAADAVAPAPPDPAVAS